MTTLKHIDVPGCPAIKSGKVREIFDCGDALLFLATDRISAYDVILPTPIPEKGNVLTGLSCFWFEYLKDIVPSHFITADIAEFPAAVQTVKEQIEGRSMIVKKADVVSVECVVRGYLAGSGWKEYQADGTVCGIALPDGLRESDKLPEPIFTPATKAETGHDENISFERMIDAVGKDTAETLRRYSCELYMKASDYARSKGIILADTKFEFGYVDGTLTLIDEVLTPDSSRFWPADQYEPGHAQPSFDKQYVRDYLSETGWDKEPPAPELPEEVVTRTSEKYKEARRILAGI